MRFTSLFRSILVLNALRPLPIGGVLGGEQMRPRRIDASDGGAGRGCAGSKRLQKAMLLASGEGGYAQVTLGNVAARAGMTVEEFEAHFTGLRECFTRSYEEESRLLSDRILLAGASQPTWGAGLSAALAELGAYLVEQPLVARALLVEVHVAGHDALACRTERFERLSRALDSARRETDSRHSPPPLTAFFMVSTIESTVVSMLIRETPREFLRVVPELELLIHRAYFAE
jgi:AcrR family transcriptional regulator